MPVQHTITLEEKEMLTGQAANLFKSRHPEYWPTPANSQKLVGFIESQLGTSILEHPYPLQVENFEAAYEHILATSWFCQRDPEVIEEDPAVVKERQAQERVRADYDARQQADKIARDKAMPISQLGAKVSQQNAQFREQRDRNELPVRAPGTESQRMDAGRLGIQARARIATGNAHPELQVNSPEWNRYYAEELSRLRSE